MSVETTEDAHRAAPAGGRDRAKEHVGARSVPIHVLGVIETRHKAIAALDHGEVPSARSDQTHSRLHQVSRLGLPYIEGR